MPQSLDAVVAGHICLDMTPAFQGPQVERLSDVLRPGVLEHVGPLTISTGGAVANTALPLLKMGLRARLMGKCGHDPLGGMILDALEGQAPGSGQAMQVVQGEQTSYTVVLALPGMDRLFLHNPGANDTFGPEDIDMDAVGQARLFHFGYSSLMKRMYEAGGAELTEIFQRVKALGVTTSLDTSCPPVESQAALADWPEIFSRTLALVDLFLPSAEELLLLLDRQRYLKLQEKAGDKELLDLITPEILSDLAQRCIDWGAGVVLIKCGRFGIYARTASRDRLRICQGPDGLDLDNWSGRELMVPSFQVGKVVSATGAGDCAIAGFLAGWLRSCPLEEALDLACGAGAQNVTAADSISGIQTLSKTRHWLQSRPPRNPVGMDFASRGWRGKDGSDCLTGPQDRKI